MSDHPWALVQYAIPDDPGGSTYLGVLVDGAVRAAPDDFRSAGLMDALSRWDDHAPALRRLDVSSLVPVPGGVLIAPLTYPRKVICAGANYYSHAQEMGTQPPDPDGEPFFFLKPPTTTIVGPWDEVSLPDGESNVDWEAELAVVIGRGGRDISAAEALDHVAGYAVANDLSARGLFPRTDAVFPPFDWDWLRHKGFDGFCPLGPGVVPSWLIEDPHDLGLRLSVNGQLKQDGTTADMVVPIPRLIAAASRILTLEPGDVILTGTPAGVGMPRHTFLCPGDVVVTEIERIGRLENRMVKP
ncbi:fumarylacetoacetate hydrolase family protein [Kribbella sp. NPDC050820]|uniref:fumarylacetoacetate hydrolase family protein n=1 Tax=Kribbella sp. NPDC050820 TaxID=3155408 RepID=UPI0033C6D134